MTFKDLMFNKIDENAPISQGPNTPVSKDVINYADSDTVSKADLIALINDLEPDEINFIASYVADGLADLEKIYAENLDESEEDDDDEDDDDEDNDDEDNDDEDNDDEDNDDEDNDDDDDELDEARRGSGKTALDKRREYKAVDDKAKQTQNLWKMNNDSHKEIVKKFQKEVESKFGVKIRPNKDFSKLSLEVVYGTFYDETKSKESEKKCKDLLEKISKFVEQKFPYLEADYMGPYIISGEDDKGYRGSINIDVKKSEIKDFGDDFGGSDKNPSHVISYKLSRGDKDIMK